MNDNTILSSADRMFLRCGIALFLLGLVSGLVVPVLTNPRMGVSAHLEGVMNGTFLVIIGLIWGHVSLGDRARSVARILILFGTYTNWIATELAAAFGTSALTPIAGAGHAGTPWQEHIVSVLLYSLSLAIIAGTAMVLWGLRGSGSASR